MKFRKFLLVVIIVTVLFSFGRLVADKQLLRTQLVRLHIIAASDSIEDQSAKLAVRNSLMEYLQVKLKDAKNVSEARQIISQDLSELESISNLALSAAGSNDTAKVILTEECFDQREYDTFSLPSGVYESLQVKIGKAEGKNWWCVVFPAFCVPATVNSFEATAVSSGFDQGLVNTLANDGEYQVRFFLLDCIGKIENFFAFS